MTTISGMFSGMFSCMSAMYRRWCSGFIGWLVIALMSSAAQAANPLPDATRDQLGLTDYQYFVAYPHLERALRAQRQRDEATTLRELKYLQQRWPDNVPVALYLADAYRAFGQTRQALELLAGLHARHPDNARLAQWLASLPAPAAPAAVVPALTPAPASASASVTTVAAVMPDTAPATPTPQSAAPVEVHHPVQVAANPPLARRKVARRTVVRQPLAVAAATVPVTDCQTLRQRMVAGVTDATAWRRLGACYQDQAPRLALDAYRQAEALSPDPWTHSAVAYQAYRVQDYATALQAWQAVGIANMDDQTLMAAANTAQEGGDVVLRDRWLDEAHQRGLDHQAQYWWLHAQRYLSTKPASALGDLDRALQIGPSVKVYQARAAIYQQQGRRQAAIADLRQALSLEPDNSAVQAALGYALWANGEVVPARDMLEKAHRAMPDDPGLVAQLAYIHQRLGDWLQTQQYAQQAITDLDNRAARAALTPAQQQQRFDFRRLHEESGRRWTFNLDTSIGLHASAHGAASQDTTPGQSYRSYGQFEAQYRFADNLLFDGDQWSVYSRVFADSSEKQVVLPAEQPMWGSGLRWKPLRDVVWFLAAEQQLPLDHGKGQSDLMLRTSASFLNGGAYSDEWHPVGQGWFAQNLYLDAAHYVRQSIQSWTADYRASWHQKVGLAQTVEPYAHLQQNGYRDASTIGMQLAGAGMRWNIWYGESRYDAWAHKVSLGIEYQRTLKAINQDPGGRNSAFFTAGLRW